MKVQAAYVEYSTTGVRKKTVTELSGLKKMISCLPLFINIPLPRMEEIISQMVEKKYEPGEVVVSEGDPPFGLYILFHGALKATRTFQVCGEQQEDIIHLEPGSYFEELALQFDMPMAFTTVAVESSSIFFLERESYLQLKKENDEGNKEEIDRDNL